MKVFDTPIRDLYEIEMTVFTDARGWFGRSYCKKEFAAIGHDAEWTQLNHSFTKHVGSIRGMHYQIKPFAEAKMIRCIAGAVFDVAIDLRSGSDTFLQTYSATLSAGNRRMLYLPPGFAHGFQTLTADCELLYHHTSYFEPQFERGIRYDDPTINIKWPLPPGVLSDRDMALPYITSSFQGV